MNDVVVIGGGAVGLCTARELAKAGLRVTLLERSAPGAEASSAAAGILGPSIEANDAGIALRLGLRARVLHEALAEELRTDHQLDIGFRRSGLLRVAFDDRDWTEIDAHASAMESAGVAVERLSGSEATRREPSLPPTVARAVEYPDEAQLDPPRFVRALAILAERAGVTIRTGAEVDAILSERDRVVGVSVSGERVGASHVVVCAGSWSSLVPGLSLPRDAIYPVRGQIVSALVTPPPFSRIVFGTGGYVVARSDGRVIAGSTEERVGFRRGVTMGGLEGILKTAITLAPSLADATVEAHWSSFRPTTRDHLPLLGRLGPEGLFLASGHFRNGILLSTVTGEILRDLVVAGKSSFDLTDVDPMRFMRGAE